MTTSAAMLRDRFRLPISLRLTLWYGASMLILLGLFSGFFIASVHVHQHVVLHQRLFKTQSDLMAHVMSEGGRPSLQPALVDIGGALQVRGPFGTYARLLSPEGQVWEQSANFDGEAGFAPHLPEQPEIVEIEREWKAMPMRSFYAPIQVEEALVGWLEVSGFAWNIQLHTMVMPLGMAILATVLLALGGGYILARRALKPVVRLTEAANRITASALGIRLPVDAGWRDELTDLADTFNTMIARLEAAFARERRFTADAAHELLNPLAAIRNEAEVALRRPRDDKRYQQTVQAILADARRLGKIVEQLLDLARLETGADLPREVIEVSRLGAAAVARWEAAATAQHLRFTSRADPALCVQASAIHLDTVLDNLLENALKYTPEGGEVTVTVEAVGRHVSLSVTDTGIGFEPGAASCLFDRFHRASAPGVHAQPGSGLGLAIVRAIVEAYGGQVTAASEGPHRGSRFVVRWPRADCTEAVRV